MEIVKKEKRVAYDRQSAVVLDYETENPRLSGAVAEIRGRYPAEGFVLNRKIVELAFVMKGSGDLLTPERVISLAEGDLVMLEKEEAFAWYGDMDIFIATAPRFDLAQYEEV